MAPLIAFGPFRLDPEGRRLMRGDTSITLRRKAWEVLCYLGARPETVVPHEELLDAVWPGTAVTPQTLTNVIRELRLALGDGAGASRWIQTVRGRGHVFLGAAADDGGDGGARRGPIVVGRSVEHERLAAHFARALQGVPQLVFVSGEPGIGKTTLVDAFVGTHLDDPTIRHGRGACIEQHGRPEHYLPLLRALDHMASGHQARAVVATLRRSAPAWLMRLPHLLRPDERLRIEPSLVGATATRLLREGLGAVTALAETAPVLLVVEDLHWADVATLDLLAALARDAGARRLLVIATFRPVDAAIHDHPVTTFARELVRERRAAEIALAPFDARTVADYLTARLGPGTAALALAARLDALSAGNPLFLRALVDDLVDAGAFHTDAGGWRLDDDAERLLADLPESLRAFVVSEAARLPPPLRRVVEASSVLGIDALVPELARALQRPEPEVAEACEQLAAVGRLFRRAGEGRSHDGTPAGRYAFPHAAHRRIVYDGLAIHDRRVLHERVARGLQAAAGTAAPTIAARLAAHYDAAGLAAEAGAAHDLAAAAAEARCAYGEAAAHLATALDARDAAVGPRGDATAYTARLRLRLGECLVLAHGYSQPEVEHAYGRALAVFEREGDTHGIFRAEMGLAAVDLTRARHRAAYDRTRRLTAIATGAGADLIAIASCWAGFASSALGELADAHRELETGIAAATGDPPFPRNFSVTRMLRSQLALVLTVEGRLAEAAFLEDDARARSRAHGAVSELAHAALLAAERAVFRRDAAGRAAAADAAVLAEANGLASFLALLRIYAAALDVGAPAATRLAVMRDALADRVRLGDRWHTALLHGLLAETALAAGDVAGARDAVDAATAHVAATDERYYEAEICRLRAECLLATGGAAAGTEARRWLTRALAVARGQGACLFADRAAERLATLAG